jgi:hypothetical protein
MGEDIIIEESADATSGVGGWTVNSAVAMKGALCGKGDMSIESFPGPGEDDGRGGVVMFSTSG